jgi:CRP/FNR family cyclic AMP-dependent transcriptional regulator
VSDLLGSIDENDRRTLLRAAVRRRFARSEIVFHEGDPGDALHIVTKGIFIARSSSTLGQVIAVNVFPVGAVFGELVLLTPGARRNATVAALGAGETLMLGRNEFEDLRSRTPIIDRFLVTVLAERNRALNAHLVELLFTPVEPRVYRRLLAFAAMVGTSDDGWVQLGQGELATLAGTTRATVNRALRKAEEGGLIEIARGRVRVVDRAALEHRAR